MVDFFVLFTGLVWLDKWDGIAVGVVYIQSRCIPHLIVFTYTFLFVFIFTFFGPIQIWFGLRSGMTLQWTWCTYHHVAPPNLIHQKFTSFKRFTCFKSGGISWCTYHHVAPPNLIHQIHPIHQIYLFQVWWHCMVYIPSRCAP